MATKLENFEIDFRHGLAKSGLFGSLSNGTAGAIGLRADMDALEIDQKTVVVNASNVSGKIHACGYFGDTTMILGAANDLSGVRKFSGTVILFSSRSNKYPALEGRWSRSVYLRISTLTASTECTTNPTY